MIAWGWLILVFVLGALASGIPIMLRLKYIADKCETYLRDHHCDTSRNIHINLLDGSLLEAQKRLHEE